MGGVRSKFCYQVSMEVSKLVTIVSELDYF